MVQTADHANMPSGGSAARRRENAFRRLAHSSSVLKAEDLVHAAVFLAIAFLVLYPVIWIVIVSFQTSTLDAQYTLRWYGEVFATDLLGTAKLLVMTLFFTLGGTAVGVLIGVTVAFLVTRTDLPGRGLLQLAFLAPFFLTPLILAVSWTLLASPRIGLYNVALRSVLGLDATAAPLDIYSLWGMMWVVGLHFAPYSMLLTGAALRSIDPTLEEAARMAGAGPVRTLFSVTLSSIRPAIYAAGLLGLVLGFGQFGIPAVLGVPARIQVVTTAIYAAMSQYPARPGYAAVLSIALMVVTLLLVSLQRRILGGRSFATLTARGFRRPYVARLGVARWPLALVVWVATFIVAVIPLLVIAWASISAQWPGSIFDPQLTLRNYEQLTALGGNSLRAIQDSFVLSVVSAAVAVAIGLLVSMVIARRAGHWVGRALEYVATLPIAFPGVVFAVGLLAAYIHPPVVLYNTPFIVLLAYVTLFLPVAVMAAAAALTQLDPALEESARVSGAGGLRRTRDVVIPLVSPSLVAAWVLVFATLMKEFSSSMLVGSAGIPLNANVLWNLWDLGNFASLGAYEIVNTLLMAGAVGLVLILGRLLSRGRER